VYLDFADAIQRLGKAAIAEKYGNLFEMYERITAEDPYQVPMRIFPASHYTMGGLWVDYNLMSTIPGLFVLGEANFSDHGANRLGASALMQGLADGYFVIPYTIGHYFAGTRFEPADAAHAACRDATALVRGRIERLLAVKGKKTVDDFHRALGKIMWEHCGMARTEEGLTTALERIPELRAEFWRDGAGARHRRRAEPVAREGGRVADFLELAELMCRDAAHPARVVRGHFRTEFQTADGEARRDDADFCHVAAWEYRGDGESPRRHVEPLAFEYVPLQQRSYK